MRGGLKKSLAVACSTLALFGTLIPGVAAGSSKEVRPHVVGAGLGRTGTMSFKKALETLGLGKVFHMLDSFERIPELNPLWHELALLAPVPELSGHPVWPPRFDDRDHPTEKSKRVELIRTILGINQTYWKNDTKPVYHSNVDFPLCFYFRDILEVYEQDGHPIKVVLTTRDNGHKWARSALGAILNWHPSRRRFGHRVLFNTVYRLGDAMLDETFFRFFPRSIRDDDVDYLAQMHDSWNEYVRQTMMAYAADRGIALDAIFLEYQLKEGWPKLCDFLEISDCPESEFPHINDHESVQKVLADANRMGYMIFAGAVACGLLLLALIQHVVHRSRNRKSKLLANKED